MSQRLPINFHGSTAIADPDPARPADVHSAPAFDDPVDATTDIRILNVEVFR